jgi:hypothetical protein
MGEQLPIAITIIASLMGKKPKWRADKKRGLIQGIRASCFSFWGRLQAKLLLNRHAPPGA